MLHGGDLIARALQQQNVKWVFTLCGGHISPILTACRNINIRVIDVRHEATAVFAADSVSRISEPIGVAAVTAGPGLTNTITAIKNAQMAQVAVLILGGATATVLKNRGSLQDIDHLRLVQSITKFSKSVKSVRNITPSIEKAIHVARSGVPGPVYIELPVDLLYPESVVREWYGLKADNNSMPWHLKHYLKWSVNKIFKNKNIISRKLTKHIPTKVSLSKIKKALKIIRSSSKPVLLIGSQVMLNPKNAETLVDSIKHLKIPVYVSGTGRGLLSYSNLPILRHLKKNALKEADTVILAGVPCDFRLDYGRHINKKAKIISINLSKKEIVLNRKPALGIKGDPATFLINLKKIDNNKNWGDWFNTLKNRDEKRFLEISKLANKKTKFINPIKLFFKLDSFISPGDILVADGGDFVATGSYILTPRSLLGWLDPGVFGTLGVGAGFILGSRISNPDSIVWAIFGDGAFGYSLSEFDTFVRHEIPVVAIIGNDCGWGQIARDQVSILNDSIGTDLAATDYHKSASGLGCVGYFMDSDKQINEVLEKAKKDAINGRTVVINARIGKTDFRKGSISI